MRNHTSLLAWQLARSVTRASLAAARAQWKPWGAAVFWQLQRASLSVQLNIAEGYARRGHRAFLYHLDVAYGSAVETGELLQLSLDEQLIERALVEQTLSDCQRCQRVLLGLMRRLKADE